MLEKKIVIFLFQYSPVLRIVQDGCLLKNVEFVVLKPPKSFQKILYHFLRIVGLRKLALFAYSPSKYNVITTYKKRNISALFWGAYGMPIWELISKTIKPIKKYVFSWSPIDEEKHRGVKTFNRLISGINEAKKNGFIFATYNPNDAEKYDMNLTTQVYRKYWDIDFQITQRDFYFIGKSKGRKYILETLKKELTKRNFSIDFKIFEDKSQKFIPYEDNIRLSLSSRCIVDVIAKNYNAGQTLRPLEALFFKKKLLTNDSSIVNSDFYHPDNIFIFDENNITLNGIENFMEKPFHEIDESITNKYDVNYWLKHFFINGDA